MKSFRRSSLVLGFLVSMASIPAAHAEFKCDQPQLSRVDAVGCAKAGESTESLRRFIQRTQRIYGLQMSDYVRFEGDIPHTLSSNVAKPEAPKAATDLASTAPIK